MIKVIEKRYPYREYFFESFHDITKLQEDRYGHSQDSVLEYMLEHFLVLQEGIYWVC